MANRNRTMHEGMELSCRAFDNAGTQAFQGDNGMMTSVWGPPLWFVLHMMTFNYPTDPSRRQRRHYRRFFRLLRHVLPCGACRQNLKRNLRTCPLTDADLESRDALSRWLHRLHTQVSESLGKAANKDAESFETVRTFFEHFRARCTSDGRNGGESGCVIPAYSGEPAWCRLQILPRSQRSEHMNSICMHEECVLRNIRTPRTAGRDDIYPSKGQ